MNAPDPPHLSLKWRFGAFRTIWVHLGPFCCLTNLVAKRAKLVQKFVPRSRVGIFYNECSRSTPLDPKLMFWCVLYRWVHSRQFGCLTKIGAKRAEQVCSCCEVVSEFFATNAPDPTHWTISWRFGLFRAIWGHSGPFGCLTKLDAIRAELLQKFVPRSRIGIFRNKHTRSTPLDPKLIFLCVFVLFGFIRDRLVPLRNSVQNGPN